MEPLKESRNRERQFDDDLPFSFLNRHAIKAKNNEFINREIPYVVRKDGIYVDGKEGYRLNAVPVIVEKEKDRYLMKTTVDESVKAIAKTLKSWIDEGYTLYFTEDGRLTRRHPTDPSKNKEIPRNEPRITTSFLSDDGKTASLVAKKDILAPEVTPEGVALGISLAANLFFIYILLFVK